MLATLIFVVSRCWRVSKRDATHMFATSSAAEASAVRAPASPATIQPSAIAPSDEGRDAGHTHAAHREQFIQRLHVLETTNPRLAASLALEDRERFPNSPDADERDAITVAALHNQRELNRASSEAWYYFVHHPNGKYAKYLSELTHVSPLATAPMP